jgi:hypothetical protein
MENTLHKQKRLKYDKHKVQLNDVLKRKATKDGSMSYSVRHSINLDNNINRNLLLNPVLESTENEKEDYLNDIINIEDKIINIHEKVEKVEAAKIKTLIIRRNMQKTSYHLPKPYPLLSRLSNKCTQNNNGKGFLLNLMDNYDETYDKDDDILCQKIQSRIEDDTVEKESIINSLRNDTLLRSLIKLNEKNVMIPEKEKTFLNESVNSSFQSMNNKTAQIPTKRGSLKSTFKTSFSKNKNNSDKNILHNKSNNSNISLARYNQSLPKTSIFFTALNNNFNKSTTKSQSSFIEEMHLNQKVIESEKQTLLDINKELLFGNSEDISQSSKKRIVNLKKTSQIKFKSNNNIYNVNHTSDESKNTTFYFNYSQNLLSSYRISNDNKEILKNPEKLIALIRHNPNYKNEESLYFKNKNKIKLTKNPDFENFKYGNSNFSQTEQKEKEFFSKINKFLRQGKRNPVRKISLIDLNKKSIRSRSKESNQMPVSLPYFFQNKKSENSKEKIDLELSNVHIGKNKDLNALYVSTNNVSQTPFNQPASTFLKENIKICNVTTQTKGVVNMSIYQELQGRENKSNMKFFTPNVSKTKIPKIHNDITLRSYSKNQMKNKMFSNALINNSFYMK